MLSQLRSGSIDEELQTPCNGNLLDSDSLTVVIKSNVVDAHVEVTNFIVIQVMLQVLVVKVGSIRCQDLLLLLIILIDVDLRRSELVHLFDVDG